MLSRVTRGLSAFAEGDEFGGYGDAANNFYVKHGFERFEVAGLGYREAEK